MKQQELLVNLFEVHLPDKAFALQSRILADGDILKPNERILVETEERERKAVLVVDSIDKDGYEEELISTRDLPPFLVQSLLENGLQAALARAGKEIERTFTSLVAFDPKDTVATSETFLELRKGVEFCCENVSFDRRETYAFYASLKVRLRFTVDLLDAKLAAAAEGKEVFLMQSHGHRSVLLQKVDRKSSQATIYDDRDSKTSSVPISQLHVPASRPILVSYCQSIGKTYLAQQLIHQAQEASFRLTRNGNKNRGWLKSELEFVRAWLLHASPGGRLVFTIPNTMLDVYLSATPATARLSGL